MSEKFTAWLRNQNKLWKPEREKEIFLGVCMNSVCLSPYKGCLAAVDGLHLVGASNKGFEHILEHLSPQLADLQHLLMIDLLLIAVVQGYLVGNERQA